MHRKLWFASAAVLAALAIASYASGPPEYVDRSREYARATVASVDGRADPGKTMICEESMPLGSHIRSSRCWSKRELGIKTEADWRDRPQSRGPGGRGTPVPGTRGRR